MDDEDYCRKIYRIMAEAICGEYDKAKGLQLAVDLLHERDEELVEGLAKWIFLNRFPDGDYYQADREYWQRAARAAIQKAREVKP